jgi:hypothetical protein
MRRVEDQDMEFVHATRKRPKEQAINLSAVVT